MSLYAISGKHDQRMWEGKSNELASAFNCYECDVVARFIKNSLN